MTEQMLFTAPIVALLCIYAAFVYGLLYLLLTTITPTFVSVYGFTLGSAGLAYIGLVSRQPLPTQTPRLTAS